ncbi:MAG: Asp-tRNA(Asn)/Glu-tRNA(Gln) amidotransferase GatCAB subunit C [Nitrospirae bacterium CG18_big_fil_WC_8_21_14_2_50_70_55]|nr:Asp-tRNA(Asn)/Glu-tRNA(Gln) amidotransferase subunit GatC [Deltaproteobacteria bacterium]OIP65940.1 MAG: glutamyl-tRNA amidotransferase [Nitrospirae bacterium CG2_30_70_394]PIQ03606.1 MAG: Asp-tRNA(Asn)/Glu-tRNA(Gln) amidotransferase GatCAB subunit C [Nitrospirae bacterium CG18_big_fil_WC_8_21_14_2_50_70_55]PIU79313.1 MAG: Asp-tRNA(Asn)/Glu-tRNA(Gln) amidotransferase GatCAB subunit C [Nitrospirae bacterium CG06_land_8_20_14_3_00_70_43]PIW83373.1 MAG: Asp-tRNA(Asn)/Glu-tRNA(Gln) amidotransfer
MDLAEVKRIGALARLALGAEETVAMGDQLTRILDYVAQLAAVDTTGVEPTTHPVTLGDAFRDDVVRPSLDPAAALANAPATDGASFIVPRIL